MQAFRAFVLFQAVLGTAVMLSDLADQAPGGRSVGWSVVGISWLLVLLLGTGFSKRRANASA